MVTITPSLRETTYSPVSPTTDFPVGFPIFGRNIGEFPATDLEVVVNDAVRTDFTVIATFAEGVATNAVVRMATSVSGSVIVRGRRTPRRTDQYANGAPLSIRDHNYSLNRLEAEMQEARRDADRFVGGLAVERADRIAADAALGDRIDQEAIARANGDAASAAALNAETQERIAADLAIHAQIDGIIPAVTDLTARAEAAAESSESSAIAASDLVEAATSGFQGFIDGIGYDFGFITQPMTYFDRDFGSIADPVLN